MRSPVDERGSSCRKTSMSCHTGTSFSMPMTVTSTSGSVVHIRPLPSDSNMDTVPVSATAKFPPEDVADLGAVAMDRGDEDVRGGIVVELDDELGEVCLDRCDPGSQEVLVQGDLVGRNRLHLHHLVDRV